LISSARSKCFRPSRSSSGCKANSCRKRSTSRGPTGTPLTRSAASKSPRSANGDGIRATVSDRRGP
jgi:hypothetical protein